MVGDKSPSRQLLEFGKGPTIREGLNSDPRAIPLFQTCNDATQKVSTFVFVAMSVKVSTLDPTTELNIHTAFSSAIAGELRRCPLIRVIYRVDSHCRYLHLSQRSSRRALLNVRIVVAETSR